MRKEETNIELLTALNNGATITGEAGGYITIQYPKKFVWWVFIILVIFFFPLALLQILMYAVERPKVKVIKK